MAQVSVSHRSPGRWGSGGSPPPRVLSAPSGAGSGRRGRRAGAATVARGLGAQRTVWEQRGDSGTVPGKLGCQWELSAPRSRGSGQGPGDRSRLRPARRPGAAETPAPRPRRTSYPSPPSPSTQSQPGRASAASQRTLGSRGSLQLAGGAACRRERPAWAAQQSAHVRADSAPVRGAEARPRPGAWSGGAGVGGGHSSRSQSQEAKGCQGQGAPEPGGAAAGTGVLPVPGESQVRALVCVCVRVSVCVCECACV